jgi:hypothetical protein
LGETDSSFYPESRNLDKGLQMGQKAWVLVALGVASFLSGVIDQYFYPGREWPPSAMGFTVIGIFLVFIWYRLDSEQMNYRRSPWLNVGVIAIAIVALPYYFLRSRGLKKGALATLAMLLAIIACNALWIGGTYASYYGLQS